MSATTPFRGEASGSHAEDLELVRATLHGDPIASARFGERLMCVHRILGAINRDRGHALDDHELLDVVQDSLAVLWSKRDSFRGAAAIETWAYRVASLEWLGAVQRRRRHDRLPEELSEAREWSPTSTEFERAGEEAEVLGQLEKLGPPDAVVIRYRHFDELSFEEIGRKFEASPSTVKYWYYRGMAKLRHVLLPHFEGAGR